MFISGFSNILVFTLFSAFLYSPAQTGNSLLDLKSEALLKEKSSLVGPEKSSRRKKGIGNMMLTGYQKHISVLISADCLYVLSCSRYSREAINKHGLFAGVLLTADRLSRCSFPCSKDIPDYKFNEDGLAEDSP